jgi:hypothetical protein
LAKQSKAQRKLVTVVSPPAIKRSETSHKSCDSKLKIISRFHYYFILKIVGDKLPEKWVDSPMALEPCILSK